MYLTLLRTSFVALLCVMLYFALTPGPLGGLIPVSEHRHVLAFSILPLVSSLAWPNLSYRLQFIGYAMLGGAIEIAQNGMHLGREGNLYDWMVDCIAAAIVLALVALWRRQSSAAAPVEQRS